MATLPLGDYAQAAFSIEQRLRTMGARAGTTGSRLRMSAHHARRHARAGAFTTWPHARARARR